jgi:hypothetical protein
MANAGYWIVPRHVPLSVQVAVIFGGVLSQLGWFLFGFGMIFFWIFGANSDIASLVHFRGNLATAQGEITESWETNFSVGGSDDQPGTPVYAHHYTFRPEPGEPRTGISYATGRRLEAGTAVTIEHPVGRPAISRVQGMRTAVLPVWGSFVAIFPVVGLGMLIPGFLRGVRGYWLLKHGQLAIGTLVSKTATATQINDRTVYKMTFEFTASDGTTQLMSTRTHRPERLEDEDDGRELVLYRADRPQSAVLLDSLPGEPTLDEHGTIDSPKRARSWLYLVAPTLSILGHGCYFLIRYVV